MPITVKDILTAIPGRFDAEAAGDWKADIQFNFTQEGTEDKESWRLCVADGKCEVKEGETESPTAKVTTSADTWIGMTTGSVNAMQAFMGGKLKVEGNMGDVMKLNNPKIFKREKE